MPKTGPTWNPAEYATVAERLTAFYAAFPFGRIETELHSREGGQITFRALVFRTPVDSRPAATGWASEREGDGEVNTVACLENAETSAIGRALANLGFSAARARPSREEMQQADRRRRSTPGVRLVREGAPPPTSPTSPAPASGTRAATSSASALLQQTADALLDALTLLATAERAGYPAARARRLRDALVQRSVAPSTIQRAERELRAWLEAETPDPVFPSGDSTPDTPADPTR